MKILACDTTAATASVALTDGRRLLGLYTLNASPTHSETLLPMVEDLLKNARLSIGDIGLIACAAGPGSFTGVRIGVSLVKGLAFARDIPCAGVSTLEALAFNLSGYRHILACPVMDARRSQLYNALFLDGRRLTPDRLISAAELRNELEAFPDKDTDIRFAGDGFDLAVKEISLPRVKDTPELLKYQNAYSVAVCGYEKFLRGEYTGSEQLSPVYLRASQAERERNEREKNGRAETAAVTGNIK